MALCGTCYCEEFSNSLIKIDRMVSGVSLRRLLEDDFHFYPKLTCVCKSCDRILEQIVKINDKLQKLTVTRNTLIDSFKQKLHLTAQLTEFRSVSEHTRSTAIRSTSEELQGKTVSLDVEEDETSPQPVFTDVKENCHDDDGGSHDMDIPNITTSIETATILQHMSEGGQDTGCTYNSSSPSEADASLVQTQLREKGYSIGRKWNSLFIVPSTRAAWGKTTRHRLSRQGISQLSAPYTPERDDGESGSNDLDSAPAKQHESEDENGDNLSGQSADKAGNGNTDPNCKTATPYTCGLCSKAFSLVQHLSKHMYTHKQTPKWVLCGWCGQTFKISSLLAIHIKQAHTTIDHHCAICSKAFTDPLAFWAHQKAHRDMDEKVYHCKRCPETFHNTMDLQKHRKEVHDQPKVYLCQWCSKTFTNSSSFAYHCKIHTGEKPHKCELCPAAFKESTKLKNHMNKHSGAKPFKCDKCPQAFPYPSGLATHSRIHKGEKQYKCELCSKDFLLPLGLRNHMRSAHNDVRPYMCEVCSASFKLQSHLKRHLIIHSGSKPFQCEKCAATFTQKGNLKLHMKVHKRAKEREESWISEDDVAKGHCQGQVQQLQMSQPLVVNVSAAPCPPGQMLGNYVMSPLTMITMHQQSYASTLQ